MGANKLDNAVWMYIDSLVNNLEKVKEEIRNLRKKREKDKSSNKQSRDNLLVEKNSLKIKRGRLFKLYSEAGESMSVSAKEDLELTLREIDEKERMIDGQISELEREMEDIESNKEAEKEIEKTCKLYQKKMDNPSFELKKFIVSKWVEEIKINDDGSIKIKIRIPEGDTAWLKERIESTSVLNMGLKFEEVIRP